METQEEKYMRHAIALAKRGIGKVNPNPLVGAVIVKDGHIIGEGYHAEYGDLHAERHALANLTEDACGATMYVTLEPCCHYGKQPPCTEAVISHGIRKVYVGSDDPNELVAGKGIAALREQGIEVDTGLLREECDALNPVFFHYIRHKTPYVVMKYAMTLDGKIATKEGNSRWITSEEAREYVQRTRNYLSGIMVGSGTVLKDNPRLTCRMDGGRNPVRIVCDGRLQIPLDSQIVRTAKTIPTYIAAKEGCRGLEKVGQLEKENVKLLYINEVDGHIDLKELMRQLGALGIDSILLEGGSSLNESAIKSGIVSCIQVYIAPKIFGGDGIYTPVGGEGVAFPKDAYLLGAPQIKEFSSGDILLTYTEGGEICLPEL